MAGFFGLFDYSKPGRGVSKNEPQKSGISLYFDIFFRRFWKFITLNLLYIVASIPAIAVIWFMSSFAVTYLASYVFDFSKISADESGALFTLSIRLALIIFALFGGGASTAGMTYVLRNYTNDTHSWVWSDFKDHYKNNFLQATAVFLIDMVVIVLFAVSLFFYSYQMKSSVVSLGLRAIVFSVFVVFTMMHMYIYPIMVTFKLKIKDIYRNALLLSMVKLPWNILAFAVSCGLIYAMIYFSLVSGLGMILIALIYMTLVTFTQLFMTNNIVRKFMLEPALASEGNANTAPTEEETVFEDVTAARR